MDLIDRQAAIDALCSECQGRCVPCDNYPCSEVKALSDLPSAEPRCIATIQLSQEQLDEAFAKVKADILSVKPKAGKWLKHKHEDIEHVECSNCKAWFLDKYFIHKSYCPNCGSYNGGEG